MAEQKTNLLLDKDGNQLTGFMVEAGWLGATARESKFLALRNPNAVRDGSGNYKFYNQGVNFNGMETEGDLSSLTAGRTTGITATPVVVSVNKTFAGSVKLYDKDEIVLLPNGMAQISSREGQMVNRQMARQVDLAIGQAMYNIAIGQSKVSALAMDHTDITTKDKAIAFANVVKNDISAMKKVVINSESVEGITIQQMGLYITSTGIDALQLTGLVIDNDTNALPLLNGFTPLQKFMGVPIIELLEGVELRDGYKVNGKSDASNVTNMGDIVYMLAPMGEVSPIAYVMNRNPKTNITTSAGSSTLYKFLDYDFNYGLGVVKSTYPIIKIKTGTTPESTPVVMTLLHGKVPSGKAELSNEDKEELALLRAEKAKQEVEGEQN